MRQINDPDVLAAWELQDGERLMLSLTKIENGVAVPSGGTLLAYAYTPNSGPDQYRPLGACKDDGLPLDQVQDLPKDEPAPAVPTEPVSPPSDEAPPQIAEIPLPADTQPPAPPDAPSADAEQ